PAVHCVLLLFVLITICRPPRFTLFPYTTLFRSTQRRVTSSMQYSSLLPSILFKPQLSHGFKIKTKNNEPFSFIEKSSFLFILYRDRKSTRLNSSHVSISYAVFCLKKNNKMCQID